MHPVTFRKRCRAARPTRRALSRSGRGRCVFAWSVRVRQSRKAYFKSQLAAREITPMIARRAFQVAYFALIHMAQAATQASTPAVALAQLAANRGYETAV